ncbi:hypothetical protein MNR01_02760 [Lysobacter sp. S4-A87]|uniref:hypothetical protein n=1 Tax=Lysobacter sp. S4-A87 TaxID=2925843 RepID=UPI001F53495E|nr:hypothetical protein [Lysobacter sp. S4-A87]UNK49979.1 hypothetical protein MNR01_02760 [Lysobacter sp. S4-A87]
MLLVAIATAALLAAWLYGLPPHAGAQHARFGKDETAPVAVTALPPGVPAPAHRNRTPSRTSLPTRIEPLSDQFAHSRDLYGFVSSLHGSSQLGNGEATRWIAQAYSECWTYALDPAGFNSSAQAFAKDSEGDAAGVVAAFDRISSRCRRFAGDRIGPEAILDLKIKAAAQGDLASEIEVFAQAAPMHPDSPSFTDERRSLLMQRALASGDPAAIAALASLMGPSARPGSAGAMPAGSVRSEAAWNLAACQLGIDCGPTSNRVVYACTFGGICGFNSVRDLYVRGLLAPSDIPYLDKEIALIVNGAGQHGVEQ